MKSIVRTLVVLSVVCLVPQFEQLHHFRSTVHALQTTLGPLAKTIAAPSDEDLSINEIVPNINSNNINVSPSKKEIISIKSIKKDDRIVLPETVATMAKSSLRLAIDLSPLPKFVSTETLMKYVGLVAEKLSRTAALIAAIKVSAFVVTGVSVALFAFPGSLSVIAEFLRQLQRRSDDWEHFWHHSLHPNAIVDQLARTSDEAMDRMGFQDRTCRERSICEIGDIIACSFPSFVTQAKDFATNTLPDIDLERNKYSRALVAGLNRTDCADNYEVPAVKCSSLFEWINGKLWSYPTKKEL